MEGPIKFAHAIVYRSGDPEAPRKEWTPVLIANVPIVVRDRLHVLVEMGIVMSVGAIPGVRWRAEGIDTPVVQDADSAQKGHLDPA